MSCEVVQMIPKYADHPTTTGLADGDDTVRSLRRDLVAGVETATSLVTKAIARIEAQDRLDDGPNAVAALNPQALAEAQAADTSKGAGLLTGVPVLIKDNIDVAGMATTAGSPLMQGNVALRDALCVQHLRDAGAVILGKATMHEWATGITSVSALHGAVRNARDPRYVAGGSSGGSASAVAAGYVAAAIGTDTAGSIRIPAAFHGLYGLRPTQGTIDMTGIVPLCPTQDIAGPIARDPMDIALLMDALRGRSGDTCSGKIEQGVLRRARFGVLRMFFGNEAGTAQVSATCYAALEQMRRLGAELVDLDGTGQSALTNAASTADFEFAAAIADYLGRRDGVLIRTLDDILAQMPPDSDLAKVLRRRLLAATNAEGHRTAIGLRNELRHWLHSQFRTHDLTAIVYPTMRRPPARLGATQEGFENVCLSACSGFPALTISALPGETRLPVGLEFLGLPDREATLLSIACDWQAGRGVA
ncbi:amidase [Marinovum sp. 1_MG-2023]|uniref:amidase n=2 Tax=unclassified Marinovum TaxID=2647166 RepID=UPI0026E21DC0|nr:amidase [Marinovum sp. 1_MG-2023]